MAAHSKSVRGIALGVVASILTLGAAAAVSTAWAAPGKPGEPAPRASWNNGGGGAPTPPPWKPGK